MNLAPLSMVLYIKLTPPESGAAYYSSSVSVRPQHYEELMNRGWRRYVDSHVCISQS